MEKKVEALYKIREQRELHNLSQKDLAEKSGVARSLINQLETGKITSTSTTTLRKLALALGCEIGDLI